MQTLPLACFLSMIRPPGVQFENALLQVSPVNKGKCPYVRDHADVDFRLYTRHNPVTYQSLAIDDDESLFASHINFHDPTVVYFHAFMETSEDSSALVIRETYMQRGDTNVIMVDSQRLEAGPWYFTAAENTWYIGRNAAQFVDYLVSRGLNLTNTHFVGHSLGAQSAGVAGGSLTSGRVSRITGLDPAWPLFKHVPLEQRLDPSDAEFVDVIHTDAGIFGYKYDTGHVDFFPNGGKSPQPGCELEVVIPQQMLLNKCENKTETLGYYIYYLQTNKQDEKHMNTIKRQLNKNSSKTLTKYGLKYAGETKFKIASNNPDVFEKIDKQDIAEQIRIMESQTKQSTEKNKNTKENPNTSLHRHRRFIPFLQKSETTENNNFLFRIMEFLFKNRKNVIPVVTVMREISTLVKSANGELNHLIKEKNNYIGTPPSNQPITYNLALDNNSKIKAFVKRLLGLKQGDSLTITGSK